MKSKATRNHTQYDLLARLKNQAKETGLSHQMCLQLFCQEDFLRRLSLSQYSSNFLLKGVIEEISHAITANDYVKIKVVNAEIIKLDKEYQGV